MSRLNAVTALILTTAAIGHGQTPPVGAQGGGALQNASGLLLLRVAENAQPTLRIVLPKHATSERSIEVLFPEHVTAVQNGSSTAEHLYMSSPGPRGERPQWRQGRDFLEYDRDLPRGIHLLARATLEDDGVLIHYEFTNSSAVAYDIIYAVTDPRLTSAFHDERLERTYVHHAGGFDLLASERRAG